jgi:hypothetical protein
MGIWRYFYVTFFVTFWKRWILISAFNINTYVNMALRKVTRRKQGPGPPYSAISPPIKERQNISRYTPILP